VSATARRTPVRASRPAGVRPRPRVRSATAPLRASGCLECQCTGAQRGGGSCEHACCCIHNYPLPAVAGLPTLEVTR